MEVSSDMPESGEPAGLPAEYSGIPAEIEQLKADQGQRAAELTPRRAELAARLAQLAAIERSAADFTGTSPAELFSEEDQGLCRQFLEQMARHDYRLATVIGPKTKTGRIRKQKSWRAYQIGGAWPTSDFTDPLYVDVFLAEDGILRTRAGGTVPSGFHIFFGKEIKTKGLAFSDETDKLEEIEKNFWAPTSLSERLVSIVRQLTQVNSRLG